MLHPRKDDNGNAVILKAPSKATSLAAWLDCTQIACVLPDGEMPATLNNIAVSRPEDVYQAPGNWEQLAASMDIDEPPFELPAGLKAAAGVVIRETDGRIWCVAPSNQFGGYQHTFPKGRPDGKSLKATALVEAFEESGLIVRLTDFLVDAKRSTTYTRYYMAERISGNPAAMGWETQAVLLAPVLLLKDLLTNNNDLPILQAIENGWDK